MKQNIEQKVEITNVSPTCGKPTVVRSCSPEIFKVEVDKVEGPKIIGKINIHNIDSSTRPKYPKKKQRYDKMPRDRDDLDSGWGTTMRAIQINFKKGNK